VSRPRRRRLGSTASSGAAASACSRTPSTRASWGRRRAIAIRSRSCGPTACRAGSLPVRRVDVPVIEARPPWCPSDVDDFVAFVRYVAERYFVRPNYLRVDGRAYFSIFDATYFVKELGVDGARAAIAAARAMLASASLPGMYLTAIEPNADVIGQVAAIGFDAVTNYVLLPEWKGEFLQDFDACVERRVAQWPGIAAAAGLPYHPGGDPGVGRVAAWRRLRAEPPRQVPVVAGGDRRAPGPVPRRGGARGGLRAGERADVGPGPWCSSRRSTSGARATTSSPTPDSAPGGSRRCATVEHDRRRPALRAGGPRRSPRRADRGVPGGGAPTSWAWPSSRTTCRSRGAAWSAGCTTSGARLRASW
jgi:hypothetical protein